uniref:Type III endosome membrane protein TEMP n=1 Tax=Caenorhabditis tropicalis TaxID=1561998 RepID=A0A1I7UV96_9PELO
MTGINQVCDQAANILLATGTPITPTTEASNLPMTIGIVAGVIALLSVGILVYFCYCRKKKVQGLESVSVGGSTQSSTGTGTTTGTVKSGTKKTVSKY